VDENIRQYGREPTYHRHTDVSYGLKELTVIYFHEQPPTLKSTIGNTNVLFAPVADVATYCILDVWNTWRLHRRSEDEIAVDHRLQKLVDTIDDPNHRIVAEMMWRGILVDEPEARKQRDACLNAIQRCRLAIWKTLKNRVPLDTPRDALRVFRSLNLDRDLDYNPFFEPTVDDGPEGEKGPEPSVTRDILTDVFNECHDKTKRKVIALFLSMWTMKQRVSSFFNPMLGHVRYSQGNLFPDRFSSTLATTRFSSSPNLQNLPGRADKTDPGDPLRVVLPKGCDEQFVTRNIFRARPGYYLVSMDLSSAEPRYLALLFQRALQDRDLPYRGAKAKLQDLRRREQPRLLRAMYEKQDIDDDYIPDDGISWPDYHDDPLWEVFQRGDDPYNALLISLDRIVYERAVKSGNADAWLKTNRWRGKKAFLALAYGSGAETLAPALKWPVQRTRRAIQRLDEDYATLAPLRQLTQLEMLHLGEVRSLWGRPRRINGFHQLTHPYPLTIEFYLMRPTRRTYHADIIPLGTTKYGIQAFVQECRVQLKRGPHVVLAGNLDGSINTIDNRDAFVRNVQENHFNKPPFANFQYSNIRWVEDGHGLKRFLPKVERGERQALNALCQTTGADHLRWLMNAIDEEVCQEKDFADCHLILTMHDSLVYEVPKAQWREFVRAAYPIMTRRPYWADIDIKADVEVGVRFGKMRQVKLP